MDFTGGPVVLAITARRHVPAIVGTERVIGRGWRRAMNVFGDDHLAAKTARAIKDHVDQRLDVLGMCVPLTRPLPIRFEHDDIVKVDEILNAACQGDDILHIGARRAIARPVNVRLFARTDRHQG